MSRIKHSLRNARMMIAGTESTLILATSLFGVWLAWNSGHL